MDYKIRLTTLKDIPAVLAIYDHARLIMRRNGNFSQWINGYPNINKVKEDVALKQSYVIENGSEILGVFTFFIGIEPTYNYIEGKWLNEELYGVIHRIGSFEKEKGLLQKCLDYCLQHVDNIRIDTHQDNAIMKHLLTKYGFFECGVIYLRDGTPRLAYQIKKIN